MTEVLYILLGWLLGLLGPQIIDGIKGHYQRTKIKAAILFELEDFQFRVALMGFVLAQAEGRLDKEYLTELRTVVVKYQGNEDKEPVLRHIDTWLGLEDAAFNATLARSKAAEGVGRL